MKKKQTLILSRKIIEKLINMKNAMCSVEEAFRAHASLKGIMPSKVYLNLPKQQGDFRAMPAYLEGINRAVVKWVNVHPNNKRIGLPTVMAVMILSDPANGFPLCIMDGTYATNLRTGAAGGIAAKYLANKKSSVVALVGCGEQALTQLLALNENFKIKEVRVWGYQKPLLDQFLRRTRHLHFSMKGYLDVKSCVSSADIIVTTTPSRKPLVQYEWLKAGVHINAIGADAKGKQELDIKILKKSKVVIDDWDQSSHSGEINVAVSKGQITRKDIYGLLGDIIIHKKQGRIHPKEITVFDSTGLGIQDVAVAHLIYETAVKRHVGKWMNLVI